MPECPTISELERAAAGILHEDRLQFIRAHVQQCGACSERFESARQAAANDPAVTSLRMVEAGTQRAPDGKDAARAGAAAPVEVPGYTVLSEIHRGGQGVVYKAMQHATNRTVALKFLPHEDAASDRQKHRFEREVNLAASLRHANIVTVYDSGLAHGRYYYAMEYVHGVPLDEYLAATPLSITQKLALFGTICSAVSYAHQQGVIHRDLKPGNVLIDSQGQPHVVDFGLAKAAGASTLTGRLPVTVTSQFMGTLAYAAPEQTRGDPGLVDARSDLYALGVILFEMVTGQPPYPVSGDMIRTFAAIRDTPPPKPSSITRHRFADLDTVALRALAKDPQRRYQSVADLGRDVQHLLAGEPIEARRDSTTYLLRSHGRSLLMRHRLTRNVMLAMLAAWMGSFAAALLFDAWPWPKQAWEHVATSLFAPPPRNVPLRDVRLVAITDETVEQLDAIAAREHLADVRSRQADWRNSQANWRSMRRLHGRLMEKLAASNVRAVVWDIAFPAAQPDEPTYEADEAYTRDLASGIQALQRAGINPVLAVPHWLIENDLPVGTDPKLLALKVGWGGITMGVDKRFGLGSMRADFAVLRDERLILGLPLAAVAAAKHPGKEVYPWIAGMDLKMRFSAREPVILQTGSFDPIESVRLSDVIEYKPSPSDEADLGLLPGDRIATYVLRLPSPQQLAAATIPYHAIFDADPTQLRRMVGGKVIVIGDLRTDRPDGPDVHRRPGGGTISGAEMHVVAIDSVMAQMTALRSVNVREHLALLLLGASIGLLCHRLGGGAGARGRWSRQIIGLAAAGLVMAVTSVIVFRTSGLLIFPFVPAIAMVLAFAGAMALSRLDQLGPLPSSTRSATT